LGGERHGGRAGVDAEHDLDLLLTDQTLDFVDRHVHLALRIRIDRLDLVFAGDAALFVDQVDRNLRADRAGDRARSRKRAGQIVDDADADGRLVRAGGTSAQARERQTCGGLLEKRAARGLHESLPGGRLWGRFVAGRSIFRGWNGVNAPFV